MKVTNASQTSTFPVHVLPRPMQEYVLGAMTLNYPTDYVGCAALVAAATAIGATYRLEVKKGWQEPAVFFVALVGNAGVRKTAALNYALWPVNHYNREQHRLHKQETAQYKQDLLQEKVGKGTGTVVDPPIARQTVTENTTTEALIGLLYQNPRGVLSFRDELASWTLDLNRYSKGADEQIWLSLWSASTIRYNRKTKGEYLVVENPNVNVIGGIQPGVLMELFGNGKRDNGFSDRILFSCPEHVMRFYRDEEVPVFVREQYEKLFKKLFALSADHNEFGEPIPHLARFLPAAKAAFIDWNESFINCQLNDPQLSNQEKSLLSKLEAYMVRLALVLHLSHHACGEEQEISQVGLQSVQGAIELITYFKAQVDKVLEQVDNPDKHVLDIVVNWLQANSNTTTARELCRARVGGITSTAKAKAIFQDLVAQGLGTLEKRKNSNGGRATFIFELF